MNRLEKLKQNFIYLMLLDERTMAPVHKLQSKSTGKMYEFHSYHTIGEEGQEDLLNFANEIVKNERNDKIDKIING